MHRKMDAVSVVVYNKRLVTFYVVSHLLYLSSGTRGTRRVTQGFYALD